MKQRRLLLVEDDQVQRDKSAEALRKRGWSVDLLASGHAALEHLRVGAGAFDVIVLDLRMPELRGEEVLERLQDEGVRLPPVIVLSAFLDENSRRKCAFLGASYLLSKPYDPAKLHEIATAVLAGSTQPVPVDFDEDLLDYMVRRREVALADRLKELADAPSSLPVTDEPRLIVARRWNSWYPSVFPVVGGAYAVVGGVAKDASGRSPVAVIDPGFQAMRALSEVGVSWSDIACCVVTHNHPDHMGGLFELMACRNTLARQTRLLCSPATAAMLGDCSGYRLEVKEIDSSAADLIGAYETRRGWTRVRLKGFDTSHEEIGRQNSSKGLTISFENGAAKSSLGPTAELVILGDTEYNRTEHRERFLAAMCKPVVKVVVLHLGSSQMKQGTGKHLYLPGLRNLLADLDAHLDACQYQGRLLVLVSEWGLEHATADQIAEICGKPLRGFNAFSPIVETVKYVQRGLSKILLLPADIGLSVGVESGDVFLGERRIRPANVEARVGKDGLIYEEGS